MALKKNERHEEEGGGGEGKKGSMGGGGGGGGGSGSGGVEAMMQQLHIDLTEEEMVEELLALSQEDVRLNGSANDSVGDDDGEEGINEALLQRLAAGGDGGAAGGGGVGGATTTIHEEGVVSLLSPASVPGMVEIQGLLYEAKAATATTSAINSEKTDCDTIPPSPSPSLAPKKGKGGDEEEEEDDPTLAKCRAILHAVGGGIEQAGQAEDSEEHQEQLAAILHQAQLWAKEGNTEEEEEEGKGKMK